MESRSDPAATLQDDARLLVDEMAYLAQAEDALRLYRQVIESSPDHISIVGPDYRYRHVNPAYVAQHGLPAHQIIGLHVADLLGREIFEQIVRPNLDRCLGGEPVSYEAWFEFRVAGRRFMRVTYSPLRTSSAGVSGVVVTARDVTPLREAQERLREENARLEERVLARTRELQEVNHALRVNEERFRAFYEDSPSMYFIVDRSGTVMSANRFGAEQLGYRTDELIGRPVEAVFHPEDRESASRALTEAFDDPTRSHQWQFRKCRKSGDVLWVQETVRSIQEPNGAWLALIVCQDITSQIRSERLLRESEQAVRSLQQATSAPGAPFDQRIQSVLELGCRRFGLPLGLLTRVVGDHLEISHVWPPEGPLKPGTRRLLSRTFCGAALRVDGPLCIQHAGRSEWSAHPAYTEIGMECYLGAKLAGKQGTYGTICFLGPHPYPTRFSESQTDFLALMARWVSDELDRRAAEQALRQSEDRFRRLFEDSPVGMCIIGQDRTIRKINPAFQALVGFEEHEIIGTAYTDYTHPDDLFTNLTLTDQFMNGQVSGYTLEKRFIRKNRSLIWVSVAVSPLILPGVPERMGVAVVQDITARKLAEQALEHRECELRQALQEREQVSQDLHDGILQSLYAVGLSLDATGRLVDTSPRRAKQELTRAISQLNRTIQEVRSFITGLSFDLLDVARFTQALQTVTAAFCKPGRTRCNITVSADAIRRLARPQCVHLIHIVREAVSNSVRHGRASRVQVTLRPLGERVQLAIRDNGHGFDPDAAMKRGYGLRNMRSRATKIGGTLGIVSKPDSGTRIVVRFSAEDHHD